MLFTTLISIWFLIHLYKTKDEFENSKLYWSFAAITTGSIVYGILSFFIKSLQNYVFTVYLPIVIAPSIAYLIYDKLKEKRD